MTSEYEGVSYSGQVQNMLHSGFGTVESLSELFDNSIDAKSNTIVSTLDKETKTLYIADSGKSMTCEELGNAHTIHRRSPASNERQGRFGYGEPQALVWFTQHKNVTRTITKCEEDDNDILKGMSSIKIDWVKTVERNIYSINPTKEISTIDIELWKKYAINPNKKGTLKIIPCETKIFDELVKKITTMNIRENICYHLGVQYSYYVNDGVDITFKYDDNEYYINSINPLRPDKIPIKNTKKTELYVYKENTSDNIKVCYKDKKKYLYRDFTSSSSGKQKDDFIPTQHILVGTIKINSAYCKDWVAIQENDDILGMDIQQNLLENREFMNGRYYKRINKIISRTDIPKPNSGDKDKYDYTTNSRHIVEFDSSLDNYFGVMLNKSKLDEKLFPKEIRNTIIWIEKQFANDQYIVSPPTPTPTPAPQPPAPQPPAPQPPAPQPRAPQPPAPQPRAPQPRAPQPPAPQPPAPQPPAPQPPAPQPRAPVPLSGLFFNHEPAPQPPVPQPRAPAPQPPAPVPQPPVPQPPAQVVETDDEILRKAGINIILTTRGVLEIKIKANDSFVLTHSFNSCNADDKNSLIRRVIRQPNHSKMSAFIEAQAKVWNTFE